MNFEFKDDMYYEKLYFDITRNFPLEMAPSVPTKETQPPNVWY